jgi:hypothetical protein
MSFFGFSFSSEIDSFSSLFGLISSLTIFSSFSFDGSLTFESSLISSFS